MEEKILNLLLFYPNGKTPTEIGLLLGKNYNTASSSVTMPLKKLVAKGKVTRNKIDGKVVFKCPKNG